MAEQWYAGDTMKTLLVRPGVEIVEKTLRGPWSPELSHLEKVYRDLGVLFRGLVSRQALSNTSTLAVGTVLRKLGEEVEFLDIPFEFGLPLTRELIAKRHEEIEKYTAKGGYDVVGISCTGSFEGLSTKGTAEAVKRALKDAKVVVGGYQATSDAYSLMEKIQAIDVIVFGDFEPIAEQLYAAFNDNTPVSSVPNILYRENGRIRASERTYVNVNPEELPVYDFSLAEKYLPKYAMFLIESSRGCVYNCSYCQENVVRKSYTVKDAYVAADEIIDAANYIAQFTEPVFFGYCDPLWGASSKWIKDFCTELAGRREEISSDMFGWGVDGRIGKFNDEELSLMKKAGCISIAYGVESLSPQMLKMMNKTRDTQKYINSVFETVEKMLKAEMGTIMLFILGMPGETPSTVEESLNNIKKLPLESKNLHMEFGLAFSLCKTALDEQIHDPKFVEEYGVRILDEYDWEKVYLPRFSLLFDPSRELSASELTDIFLDIVKGARGIPASLERQLETFDDAKTILEKDEISPDELTRGGEIYKKIMTEDF